jgi:hypothetical protein
VGPYGIEAGFSWVFMGNYIYFMGESSRFLKIKKPGILPKSRKKRKFQQKKKAGRTGLLLTIR